MEADGGSWGLMRHRCVLFVKQLGPKQQGKRCRVLRQQHQVPSLTVGQIILMGKAEENTHEFK